MRLPVRQALAWAKSKMDLHNPKRFAPHSPWVVAFHHLGDHPAFQAVQREAGSYYWRGAIRYLHIYQVNTDRAMLLFFNTDVQRGTGCLRPGSPANRLFVKKGGLHLPYRKRLVALAEAIGATASHPWRADVLERTYAIACGCKKRHVSPEGIVVPHCGTVHGTYYDLRGHYGIADTPVNPAALLHAA
ncbi:MAG: hypothetical protein KGR26_08280 [Cyanobacteria bacterium REEB65]|nr:hypothetical protein [Cyanobacteria bacterium REEB65]